ncbi:hypothetical protein HZA97_05475 [Candidatus Woesearchaeota archaeon]|nr:hypothetical protein [Candidatus Woesearchaeota archaeon]
MYLKKSCLGLVLALASFLPINANSQELKLENRNYGKVQEIEQLNSKINKLIDSSVIDRAVQNIPNELSLDSFVRNTSILSKYEKIALLGRLGSLAGYRLYDGKDSQRNANEEFMFQKLGYSIKTGENVEAGVCRQIHNLLTQTAKKWDLPAVSFSNYYQQGGHISSAVKINNKWAIINYGEIFQSKDSNLFSALDSFQKIDGSTQFQQDFYLGKKLSFVRITPDGTTFYKFNLINPTNSALYENIIKERKLINNDNSLKISNLEKSLLFKKDFCFLKIGAIEGYNSALKQSPLLKMGFYLEDRNEWSDFIFESDLTAAKFIQEKLNDNSVMLNFLFNNRSELSKTKIGRLDLLLGFDSTTKIDKSDTPPDPNFSRIESGLRLGEGKNFSYLISSAQFRIVDLLDSKEFSFMKEQHIGFKKELLKSFGFVINPDVNIRPEETKYSISAELGRNIGDYQINLQSGIFSTRTNFKEINPEKKGGELFFQIAKNNTGIGITYSKETDYWPSKDEKESFEINLFGRF